MTDDMCQNRRMSDSRSSAFPSLGFLGRFGRSADLRALDLALREVDMHPNLVPEAVKLTLVKLMRAHAPGGRLQQQDIQASAELTAYCMAGPSAFAAVNDPVLARRVERRIEAALDEDDGLDAQIILLMLHAGLIQPIVVDTFGLESETGEDAPE